MKPETLSSGLLLNTMVDDNEKSINITVGNETIAVWIPRSNSDIMRLFIL